MSSFFRKFKKIPEIGKRYYFLKKKQTFAFIDKRPFASFFIILGIFFILIVLSNILGAPKKVTKQQTPEAKQVTIYKIGGTPKMAVEAHVEKTGVIHLAALTPGVVWSISKDVGQHFVKGEPLLSLSSNYQGGNTAYLQRQLAQSQYQHALDTFDIQKDLISKGRDIVNKGSDNEGDLRDITNASLGELQSLIDLNTDILSSLDTNIANLEALNVGGANDALILSTKELKSQFLAANNGAKQGLRLSQFSGASDKPPAELSNMQKDLAIKQLDLQEKMLTLNMEMTKIQLSIAQVVEAMMYPAAPFNGTVERVFVKVGEQVNPGTELMVLTQDIESDPTTAVAFVSSEIARKVSRTEPSIIHIGQDTVKQLPSFITHDAIQGPLYGVFFTIPDEFAGKLTEKGSIQIEIPLGYADSTSIAPFVPIDAVYQTKDQSYVFVASNGIAEAKPIVLGAVYGSFVAVENGLSDKDQVIVDRNVIAGDSVSTQE